MGKSNVIHVLVGLVVSFAWAATAAAHSAGGLDARGCHDDRRRGEYHCHRGEFKGLRFRSKGDLLKQLKAGKTVADLRKEQGLDGSRESTETEDGGGWLSWLPFVGDDDEGNVGSGDVIIPRGIEQRLRTLKDLHDEGLITDEEYAIKRKEILGEL